MASLSQGFIVFIEKQYVNDIKHSKSWNNKAMKAIKQYNNQTV